MSKKQTADTTEPGYPVVQLALERILVEENENQRRFPPTPKSVQSLANSIKVIGLINPLTVTQLPENHINGKTHQLTAGYKRYRALQLLSESGEMAFETVPASVARPGVLPRDVNLAENVERDPLTLIDYAYIIKTRVDAGEKKGDVAKDLQKSNGWVSEVGAFIELRPELQKRIHVGTIPYKLAAELGRLTTKNEAGETEHDVAAQDELIAAYDAGQSASSMTEGEGAKRKKGKKRGKAGKETEEKKGISAKQAVNLFDEAVTELKEVEKPNKKQEAALELYKALYKFMIGGLGAKALDNRIMELV